MRFSQALLFSWVVVLASVQNVPAGPLAWLHAWQSDQSVDAAKAALAQNDPAKATLALQRALQLNGNNRRAIDLMAEVAGKSSAANEADWRRRAMEVSPKDPEARAAYCAAAVRAGEVEPAQNALNRWPPEVPRGLPYLRAAGQVAAARRDYDGALALFREALRQPGATATDRLNLAAAEVFSRSPYERGEGLSTLDELSANPETEAPARRTLIQHAIAVNDFDAATAQADKLVASGFTRDNVLVAAEAYLRGSPGALDNLVGRALSTFGSEGLFQGQLLDWLNKNGQSALALRAADAIGGAAAKSPFVRYARADALDRLGNWDLLVEATDKDPWPGLDLFRLAYKAHGQTLQTEHPSVEVGVVWKECLNAAGRNVRALTNLADLAARWSWQPQLEQTLWALAALPGSADTALPRLAGIYDVRKDTPGLFRVAKRTVELKPDDRTAANTYARLGLLLNVNRETYANFARQQWEEGGNRSPAMTAIYAYALSLQGKGEEAARVLETLDEHGRQTEPLYSGLVTAAIGDRNEARTLLGLAKRLPLLPEEEDLLSRALSGLAAS